MRERRMTEEERKRIHGLSYSLIGDVELFEKNKKPEEALNQATQLVLAILYEQEEAGPFQCPYCKAEPFDTREELSAHIKTSHPDAVKESAIYIKTYMRHRQIQLGADRHQARRRGAILRMRKGVLQ